MTNPSIPVTFYKTFIYKPQQTLNLTFGIVCSCCSLRMPHLLGATEHEQIYPKLLADEKRSVDSILLFYSVFRPETQHCLQPSFSPTPYTTSWQFRLPKTAELWEPPSSHITHTVISGWILLPPPTYSPYQRQSSSQTPRSSHFLVASAVSTVCRTNPCASQATTTTRCNVSFR